MRPVSIASVQYAPQSPPDDPAALGRYIHDELQKVAAAIALVGIGHLDMTYVAPKKPRDGDIRYADGTQWNPNAMMGGRGLYIYVGATGIWNRVSGLL